MKESDLQHPYEAIGMVEVRDGLGTWTKVVAVKSRLSESEDEGTEFFLSRLISGSCE